MVELWLGWGFDNMEELPLILNYGMSQMISNNGKTIEIFPADKLIVKGGPLKTWAQSLSYASLSVLDLFFSRIPFVVCRSFFAFSFIFLGPAYWKFPIILFFYF